MISVVTINQITVMTTKIIETSTLSMIVYGEMIA